jgi:hypothetical protein
VEGTRIAIIHYGEHTPLDDGYRPVRLGQLASWLTEAGVEVTRFVPTFSDVARRQRPESWTGELTGEGLVHMVPTRSYGSSRGRERLGFLRDFARGSALAVAGHPPFDLVITGYPPPGVVLALRRRIGTRVPILADIRDLWPDALFAEPHPMVEQGARMAGRLLAQELRLATGVIAMSHTMLARAPAPRRRAAIALSISDSLRAAPVSVDASAPMTALFVGLLTSFYDFESMIEGWRRFLAQRPDDRIGAEPLLRICGSGVLEDHVRSLAAEVPSIRCEGWVSSTAVPQLVAGADVGLVPPRPGLGTTLGNKVLEYLGTGLYILSSLEREGADELQAQGLGTRVTPSAQGWADGFARFEQELAQHRRDRAERRDRALKVYGREGIEPQWLAQIAGALHPRS